MKILFGSWEEKPFFLLKWYLCCKMKKNYEIKKLFFRPFFIVDLPQRLKVWMPTQLPSCHLLHSTVEASFWFSVDFYFFQFVFFWDSKEKQNAWTVRGISPEQRLLRYFLNWIEGTSYCGKRNWIVWWNNKVNFMLIKNFWIFATPKTNH